MLNEQQACAVLLRKFTEAGYTIVENHPLQLESGTLHVDGYDVDKRVGYEYITEEAEDRRELGMRLLEELEERMDNQELQILLVDELDAHEEPALVAAIDEFLAQVQK
jgi:hypothetical protein